MRSTRDQHSWSPCLEQLDHTIGASRAPGRQSRVAPPRSEGPQPCRPLAARPASCSQPSRGPARAAAPAASGARSPSTSGLVCSPGRPGGAPSADLGGPGVPPPRRPPRAGPREAAGGQTQGGWPGARAKEAGPRRPPPRPNTQGTRPPHPGGAGGRGSRGRPGRAEGEAELGYGSAGQGACVLTDQPDSEHQLSVRRLSRSHLPPPPQPPTQRAAPIPPLAGPAPPPGPPQPAGSGPAPSSRPRPSPGGPAPSRSQRLPPLLRSPSALGSSPSEGALVSSIPDLHPPSPQPSPILTVLLRLSTFYLCLPVRLKRGLLGLKEGSPFIHSSSIPRTKKIIEDLR